MATARMACILLQKIAMPTIFAGTMVRIKKFNFLLN